MIAMTVSVMRRVYADHGTSTMCLSFFRIAARWVL
jgi:hypothetical protein